MGPLLILAAAAAQPAAEQVAQLPVTPPAAAAERGVISYPPAFFAEARPVNAFDMVSRLPGFTFDKGAAVRGLAGSGGNVLIDGQPSVSKNDSLDEILKRIPAGAVERIDLIRGGAPGIDMEGRTIIANVVRRQTAGFRAAIMPGIYQLYDGRQLPGLRFEAQWRWPGGRSAEFGQVFGTGANEEFGDGPRIRYNADGTVRLRSKVDADAYGHRRWTTGAFETPLMGGRLRLNGAYLPNPSELEIYDRYESTTGLEYEKNEFKRLQAELGGRYSRGLTEKLSLETVLFHQWNNNKTTVDFQAPTQTRDFLLDKKSTEAVGRMQFRYRYDPQLTLEFGAEGALNQLDSETALTLNARPVVVPAANVQVEETRGEMFLRGTWRATPKLTLEAGVRQEGSRVTSEGDVLLEKTLTFTKPRAALTWAPDDQSQIRLRVEREVGQLNFDDFVASPNAVSTGVVLAGNPDLAPQQAWVYEAAYERRFWGAGAAVLTVRHFALNDVVDRVPIRSLAGVVLADAPGNLGTGTRDEIQGSLTVPLDRFGVRAAQFKAQLTWRDTKVDDPLLGGTREISGQRPLEWEAHFSQDLPQWKSTWGVDLLGAYRERFFRLSEIETRKVSTWVMVYGEYKPQPDWIIRLEAWGFTGRDFKRIREVYTAPRNVGRVDFTDVRALEWNGTFYLRVRKTFGG
jgi:outer membrane receptor protein involved in Fe transport